MLDSLKGRCAFEIKCERENFFLDFIPAFSPVKKACGDAKITLRVFTDYDSHDFHGESLLEILESEKKLWDESAPLWKRVFSIYESLPNAEIVVIAIRSCGERVPATRSANHRGLFRPPGSIQWLNLDGKYIDIHFNPVVAWKYLPGTYITQGASKPPTSSKIPPSSPGI